jgi:decaprenylphospho-beta-D-erythro-pentofuranosid-2-ulose 2-reductase
VSDLNARPARTVLILGATSAIARALAAEFARAGSALILAGRDMEELERSAADLRLRHGVDAAVEPFDALDFDSHPAFFRSCTARVRGEADEFGVVLCHGYLPDQRQAASDAAVARRVIDTNYTSAVSVLNLAADHLEQRRGGFICGLSSVAGDRGRQSNYLYGSSKAALSTYLQGLRNRLSRAGVRVVTVKPGFVDTKMTFGLPGMFLVATPERVAKDISRAIRRGRSVVYTPWFWRPIMLIIRTIPEFIFKRMKL